MSYKLSKFTLRIDSELLKKFHFVAEYNARSANRELELLIKKHIDDFENKHGKISSSWPILMPSQRRQLRILPSLGRYNNGIFL